MILGLDGPNRLPQAAGLDAPPIFFFAQMQNKRRTEICDSDASPDHTSIQARTKPAVEKNLETVAWFNSKFNIQKSKFKKKAALVTPL
ncbi:MAG: hypothetical protein ABIH04_01940 [Planctomycetota bacterium]